MNRRTFIVIALAGLLLGLAEWLCLSGAKPQTLSLPDGTTLTLTRVTYGKRHTERVGRHLKDYLAPLVSERLARRLDCNFLAAGGTNTLVFWLERDGLTNAVRLRVTTFDEHGCEFSMTEPSDPRYRTPQRALLVAEFDQFPRRSKTLGLRLYQAQTHGGYFKLAEFTVPNPDPRTFPMWQPEPFPITKTVSNWAVSLLELKGGVHGRSYPPQLPEPGEDWGFLLSFRLTEAGQPTSAWSLAGVRGLSDASGQTTGRGGYAGGGQGAGDYGAVIAGGLCLEEPALRLIAEFTREKNFAREEVWTVQGIPVPDESSSSRVEATNTLHGVQLRVVGISGLKCPGPDPRRSLSSYPVLNLTAANLANELELKLVAAVDDQGRPALGGARASSSPNHAFGLKLAPGARSVDVTLAVTRRITVEFLAKPTRMTAAEIQSLRKRLGYQ